MAHLLGPLTAGLFVIGLLGAVVTLDAQAQEHGGEGISDDPALVVAAEIRRRVPTFHNFRGAAPHGVFTQDPARVFAVRATPRCLAELDRLTVEHEVFRTRRSPIPAPVELEGSIAGVRFRKLREGAPFIVACELAARLPRLAAVLRDHGIVEAQVLSAWRLAPRTSFHTMGMALDLARFVREDGSVLDVERDYPTHPAAPTCAGVDGRPAVDRARALESLACDLAARAGLSTVITPDYSEGHRDHFHVDVRPEDPRLFVR